MYFLSISPTIMFEIDEWQCIIFENGQTELHILSSGKNGGKSMVTGF